ncbi:RHS repeat protein [Aquimarina sp. AU58]|uniref:RHS repeat protein n=1 Tax=Aquimarina sp. AU58 TaxID=1874112 RepID=UPI000D6E6290|nr:RHS repeat protein [Aquimarina sp. AU58]
MRIKKIYGLLLIILFYSCSNNDDNSTSNVFKKPLSIKVENSAGITSEYHFYYSNNLITKITDESGNDCKFIYDSNDRLISRKWNSNIQTNYYYLGNQLSSIKSKLIRGYTRDIYLYYNTLNQINKSIINENNEYENTYFYKYDATNRLVETIDEFGESEKYKYDNFNNPFKNVYPQMNESWQFGFWISGLKNNVIANDNFFTNELTYEYIYDSDNFPILIKEKQSGTVNYTTIITYE